MDGSQIAGANNRFIITGGPGSGKTSLVEGLQRLGYRCFPEIARELIAGGMAPPIRSDKPDTGRFFETILRERINLHSQVPGPETGFYDRGIPDSLAYFEFMGKPAPRSLKQAVLRYRYNVLVFAAPPWKEIYTPDPVRAESFEAATALFGLTVGAYTRNGYRICVLPESTVEERIAFVLDQVPWATKW